MSRSPRDTLLHRPPPSETPTPGESTLEVTVYWRSDFWDAMEAAGRRRIRVGGTRDNPLRLAPPEGLKPFTLAEIRRDRAQVRIPHPAEAWLRREDGSIGRAEGELEPGTERFLRVELGLGQRLVFGWNEVTLCLQFVRDHKVRQSLWERIRPKDL